MSILYSVFTKPWRDLSLPELGAWVARLGFDGIELPVRPGYPVEPQNVHTLPQAARMLGDWGVKIFSVAATADPPTIAACAETGAAVGCTPIIRTMARIPDGMSYLDGETHIQREYEAALPLLEQYGVQVGVQNHCGRFVNHALGLLHLLQPFDPRRIAAVWDAAHNALQGEEPDYALDILAGRLCMVNLKNAFWQPVGGPEAEFAQWRVYWTDGRHGLASWPRVVGELKKRGYSGVICLTAEYSDTAAAGRLIQGDLAFARSLFND